MAIVHVALWALISFGSPNTEPVLRLPVEIIDVVDGDTITVAVTLRMRVRLLDCWAAEIDAPGGLPAKEYLKQMATGKAGVLEVDISTADRLDDVFSFGRLLGRVFVGDRDLSEEMVGAGHATKTKRGE